VPEIYDIFITPNMIKKEGMEMKAKGKLHIEHVLSLAFPGFRYTFNAILTHANDHLGLVLPHKNTLFTFEKYENERGNEI